MHAKEQELYRAESQLQDLANQHLRCEEKITEAHHRIQEEKQRQGETQHQQEIVIKQLQEITLKISATETNLVQLTQKLGVTKQQRDDKETELKTLQNQQQSQSWRLEKITATQQEKQSSLAKLKQQLQQQEAELPNPLPEVPKLVATQDSENENITFANFTAQLEQLQQEIRQGQKRLAAMEPVNMLALEEYEETQQRLQELSEKLTTLAAERTELLLRIENFTTLRLRAFKESFNAVNENFQSIFATLSEGDGYLELENKANPLEGGLNLIAHPKGKPVQRLSSMSGGEKSLTALSFIFALQRYRPSPFYAFDEVDMFLDGANVERLAKMIKQQAQQAQFIVVSLRRPMIEASERTIGVTQARGAYTQVLGIKL